MMEILKDISMLWSMIHTLILFLFLFESRFPKKKTYRITLLTMIPLLIINLILFMVLGIDRYGTLMLATLSLPSCIVFWLLAKQQDLIASVVKKIPGTALYPEYQKYLDQNIRAAATEFLNAVMAKENQAEEIGKLVTYMAQRPGVVKPGKRGLFSQTDEPIEPEEAAAEVANHPGYIRTHIVSLHHEDAERLAYNNAEAWKSPVRRNITAIAEAHKIPGSDLQWYAAFHGTGYHPHIHLMVYSKGQEGYLSRQSIDSLRSAFANDIFLQEQYQLFQIQTGLRQDIKAKSEQKIQELITQQRNNRVPFGAAGSSTDHDERPKPLNQFWKTAAKGRTA